MFSPTLLSLLRLLAARPGGVSRQEAHQLEGATPELVDRALHRLLELGVVEARSNLVVPLPTLPSLADKMERLARRINRTEAERDQAMDLVKLLFRGP
jgi:DNA-binding IclR family transcriptional regulator